MSARSGQGLNAAACLVLSLLCNPGWVLGAPETVESKLDSKYQVGAWIWSNRTFDRQTCRFLRVIEVPAERQMRRVILRMTADNSYRVFLDGREFGQGSELRALTEYNLTLVLTPGVHVLAVEAYNEYNEGGLLAGLRIEWMGGSTTDIASDDQWWVVPEARGWKTRKKPSPDWVQATVVAPFGGGPWKSRPSRISISDPISPLQVAFWQRAWFQLSLVGSLAISMLLWLRLLGRVAVQSQAQKLIQRERARIARDIHDELGAGLTELVLAGEVAQREGLDHSEVRARFAGFSEHGRKLLSSLDEVVWMVNSQRDTLRDFEAYICRYAENFLRRAGMDCRFEAEGEIPQTEFSLAARRNLFLAVKEALHNAVKHSGASEVALNLRATNGTISVTVVDNGRGMPEGAELRNRHGLSNMKRRAVEVGGACKISNRPGGGCQVELTVPLDQQPLKRSWLLRRTANNPSEHSALNPE